MPLDLSKLPPALPPVCLLSPPRLLSKDAILCRPDFLREQISEHKPYQQYPGVDNGPTILAQVYTVIALKCKSQAAGSPSVIRRAAVESIAPGRIGDCQAWLPLWLPASTRPMSKIYHLRHSSSFGVPEIESCLRKSSFKFQQQANVRTDDHPLCLWHNSSLSKSKTYCSECFFLHGIAHRKELLIHSASW